MFLYTWDNRKEENDFSTDYTFNNFNGGSMNISKHFYYDDNITIFWDGDKIFNVLRDEVLIDSFEEQETLTPAKAELIADEFIQESLQDEMFRDADEMQDQDDEMEFQFRSPDLFQM